MKVIPTVLAENKRDYDKLFKKVLAISDTIQVDFMDGRFVETKSIPLDKVPSVKRYKNTFFEAHLMVKEPMPWATELIHKGFKRIIFHYEAVWPEDLPLIAHLMKTLKTECMMAINPGTPVKTIVPYAKLFDGILFLGVHPGRNAAPYVTSTPKRVSELRKKFKDITIQVDGGMTPKTINAVVKAGANRVNSGSYVGKATDPKKALQEMYDAAR